MKKYITITLILLAFILMPLQVKAAKPFIIDTDFSSDVDDVLAISTAMYFKDTGMIHIKGIALSCSSSRGAYAMSALLGQHKEWAIPIACDWDDGISIGCKYHLGMTEYPHNTTYYSDNVNFYRMMLASSIEPVNIVVLGQFVNISDLLNSKPDVHSPLTGAELIAQKVKCLYVVGGKANGGLENNIFYGGENYGVNKYYGNTKVAQAADNVARNCPCPIVWLEADIVGTFEVGSFFAEKDKTKTDIITNALIDYGKPYGSASFDPFAMFIACTDANNMLENYCIEKVAGTMRINLNGTSYFTENDSTRNHYRIKKLADDNFYKANINKTLLYEYQKRTKK